MTRADDDDDAGGGDDDDDEGCTASTPLSAKLTESVDTGLSAGGGGATAAEGDDDRAIPVVNVALGPAESPFEVAGGGDDDEVVVVDGGTACNACKFKLGMCGITRVT